MKQIKWVTSLMIGLTLLLGAGCASIITGISQEVSIRSKPSKAKFTIEPGELQGTTPSIVTLDKGRSYTVTIEKEGYKKEVQSISTVFNGCFLGNILFGEIFGIIGLIVDFADGAYLNLERNIVNFRLEPKKKEKEIKPDDIR